MSDDARENAAWQRLRADANAEEILRLRAELDRHRVAGDELAADADAGSRDPALGRPAAVPTDGQPPADLPPVYLAADVWSALRLPDAGFAGYYERNGWAETWAVLMAAVRGPGRCGRDVDGAPCVLAPHSESTPCHGASDVGSSEPLPWRAAPGDDTAPEPGGLRGLLAKVGVDVAGKVITVDGREVSPEQPAPTVFRADDGREWRSDRQAPADDTTAPDTETKTWTEYRVEGTRADGTHWSLDEITDLDGTRKVAALAGGTVRPTEVRTITTTRTETPWAPVPRAAARPSRDGGEPT